MEYKTKRIPITKLLIDPNNYRFYDQPGYRPRQENRFHQKTVQLAALEILENTTKYRLSELRESFLANGYIPLERIVVTNYAYSPGLYIIVEGNRRVAALQTLLRDNEQGVITINQAQVEEFQKIPCMVLQIGNDSTDEKKKVKALSRTIMGIRHIAGPQEWGAYQQAYLVLQLRDEEGREFDEIADHLNMRLLEAKRRYRAIKALKEMQNDELYGTLAKTDFYRLFHELVSLTKVREFFSWNHEESKFDQVDKARAFFEMIAPIESENPPKINTYFDVRSLREIIGNTVAEACLLDNEKTLASAIAMVQPTSGVQESGDIIEQASRLYEVLNEAQIDALKQLSDDEIGTLEKISELINSRIEERKRLIKE
jgi:hypothetical protein